MFQWRRNKCLGQNSRNSQIWTGRDLNVSEISGKMRDKGERKWRSAKSPRHQGGRNMWEKMGNLAATPNVRYRSV